MTERRFGDRVVVSWHRREYAATVVSVGKIGYLVETDEPYDGVDKRMHRHEHELFDVFNDGRKP